MSQTIRIRNQNDANKLNLYVVKCGRNEPSTKRMLEQNEEKKMQNSRV